MRIEIAQKYRPFSHRPGIRFLIPMSEWEVQIFPSKLFFQNLGSSQKEELILPIQGPVRHFTALLDLERGRIEVSGQDKKGHFRYLLTPDKLQFEKGESYALPFITKREIPVSEEKLSLGVHKKQDWEMIERRLMLEEILPLWLRLAAWIPQPGKSAVHPVLKEDFKTLFQLAFVGMLSPRLEDENFHGVEIEKVKGVHPLSILHASARQIRELFFLEEGSSWSILPNLPKELHSGRFIQIQTEAGDRLALEWTKKQIKKMVIRAHTDRIIHLHLQKGIGSFRVRENARGKGKILKRDEPLQLRKGVTLFLDQFRH